MEDRRIRKTKKAIREALLTLMLEKGFDAITINDIAEEADINRGTFYLHYADKFELLGVIEDDIIAQFQALQNNIDISKMYQEENHFTDVFIKEAIGVIKENELFFKVMFISGEKTTFESKFKAEIKKNMKSKINHIDTISDIPFDYYFSYVVNALLGILREWVKGGMVETKEQIAAYAYAISSNGPLTLMMKEMKVQNEKAKEV